MISDTRMWYGSSVFRHGRSRPWRRYHVSSRCRNRRRSGGGGNRRAARFGVFLTAISYNSSVKIYTRTGDAGETSLFDGTRVRKDDARVDAYGEVDELNAWLGFVRASTARRRRSTTRSCRSSATCSRSAPSSPIPPTSSRPRHQGGRSATTTSRGSKQLIDRLEDELPPLRRFILAGGTPAGAALHVARTVCRRAERRIVGARAAGRSGARPLRQPPVRSALRPRARRQPPRAAMCRKTRDGDVSGSSLTPLLPAIPTPASDRVRRFTASNTARASSCDTRSRIAPHSTSVVPVDRLDRHVPAVARDAVGPILEAGRPVARAAPGCRRDT